MSRLFVSHASEDKQILVRPLASTLKHRGLDVWYDEYSLVPGDSLRRSIDNGLKTCSAGIVVLSHAFFAKQWPQRELDALFSAEIRGQTQLIPIWHEITDSEVAAFSPLLADRVAIQSALGIEGICERILTLFPPTSKYSGASLAEIIELSALSGLYICEMRGSGAIYRFMQLQAFSESMYEFSNALYDPLTDAELEKPQPEIERQIGEYRHSLCVRLGIPEDVFIEPDQPEEEESLGKWTAMITIWASGTLSEEQSRQLITDLDTRDLDEFYILLGIPNFSISNDQRNLLSEALVKLGCGFDVGYENLSSICQLLRSLGP